VKTKAQIDLELKKILGCGHRIDPATRTCRNCGVSLAELQYLAGKKHGTPFQNADLPLKLKLKDSK
jgi:hypothetical protein